MVEVQDIMHPGTLKEYIFMKIVVTTTTEAVAMAMDITGKNKKALNFSVLLLCVLQSRFFRIQKRIKDQYFLSKLSFNSFCYIF